MLGPGEVNQLGNPRSPSLLPLFPNDIPLRPGRIGSAPGTPTAIPLMEINQLSQVYPSCTTLLCLSTCSSTEFSGSHRFARTARNAHHVEYAAYPCAFVVQFMPCFVLYLLCC